MTASTAILDSKHLEYKQRRDKWDQEINEFFYTIKANSFDVKHLDYNQIINLYKQNFFQTLEKIRELFKEINEQLFLDNVVKLDLDDRKKIISYEWFENIFLKDVERVFNIVNKVFEKMKRFDLKVGGIVLTNPYGKTEKELKLEKYLNKVFLTIEAEVDKLYTECFHKKANREFRKRQQSLYFDLTL
jgi:hypothetical protein